MDIEHPEFLNFLKCAGQNQLHYMCIGGYAVNYYGFHRMTEDLDIWIAPTKENKICFFNTLLCMGYTENEFSDIQEEDFTTYFMCTLGAMPHVIDNLTIVHKNILFEDAEKEMVVHSIGKGIQMNLVPYNFLKDIKIRSRRNKDLWDIAKLEELRENNKLMNFQTITTFIDNGICTITINRPDKLNALNKTVIEELGVAIDEVIKNPQIKSGIITGSGAKAFVAGADISEFASLDVSGGKALAQKGQDLVFTKIENSPKPIIAAVNGFALGGGCELAMSCHFRIASDNAKFGQPEVNLGLIPGYGGTQRLVQLIGKGRAMELLMTGNMIDANTALQYGLVNHVVAQEELLVKTKAILNIINTKAPLAIAGCIRAANAVFDESRNGYFIEVNTFGELINTADAKEGAAAFLEKRKANFTGK